MTRHLIWKASLNWSYKEMGEISQLQNWSKTKDEWKTISDDKEGAAWIKPPKRIQFHKASTEAEGRMGLEWFSVLFPPLSLGFPHQLDAFLTIDIFSTSSEKWRLRSLSTDVRSIASTTSLWRFCQHFEEGILFPPQSHGVLSIWSPPGEASHSHLVSWSFAKLWFSKRLPSSHLLKTLLSFPPGEGTETPHYRQMF